MASWNETDNYPALTAECEFTIATRPVSATGAVSKVYDGTDTALADVKLTLGEVANDDVSGVVDGDDVSAASIASAEVTYNKADAHENLTLLTENEGGLIALTGLIGEDAANYKLVDVTATGTITSQSIDPGEDPDNPDPSYKDVKISDPADVTYNGQYQESPVTVTDSKGNALVEGTDYELFYSDNLNAGPATAIIKGIGNYTGEVTKSYTVNQAAALITVNDSGKIFGEDDPEGYNSYAVTLVDGQSPLYTNAETEELDTIGEVTVVRKGEGTDETAGTYTDALDATVAEANDNYSYTVVPGDFTITPADGMTVDITTDAKDMTKVYDGGPITIEASASEAGSTLLYATNPEDPASWSTEKPSLTNVGSLTIYVKATNPNFEDSAVVSATVQVTPATITVTTPDAGKVYDGTPLTAEGEISGLVNGETAGFDTTGTRTEVGSAENSYAITFAADGNEFTAQQGNYTVDADLGTLTVFPQSIDPTDPDPDNPEPGDPDPTDPNPENPDQPFYTGIQIDSPADVPYNGEDQTWVPTVTDRNGNPLTEGEDYTVSYSTDDRTNVTGEIVVTITGIGDYAGAVERSYQVTPLTLTVTANNQTKVAGTADPALTSTYTGALPGETPGWTGTIARVPGEAAGTYQIFQNTLGIEDNGAFLAGNYTLVFVNGTLTITAAPGGGDNPGDGGDDTPTTPTTPITPGTTTDGGTPTVIEDAPEQPEPEQIDDDENPLAGPSESIDDDGTPLARPTHQDCWVHWLMILGIIVTAIYDVLVLIRRRKFTGTLASFEDEVLNDRNRNA